jgi:hypothetical protein
MSLAKLLLLSSLSLGSALLPAQASVLIKVDQSSQRMTVSVNGEPRFSWPVSTGKSGYNTPDGNFRPNRMEADHFSDEYDSAPMPHSIFFDDHGHAIHGSSERLGRAASHGCVRISPANAAQLFSLVEREGMGNTKVEIQGAVPAVSAANQPPRNPPRKRRIDQDALGEDEAAVMTYGGPAIYSDPNGGVPYRWR